MQEKLRQLTPTEFENLTFDLLQARGFRNVVWRTPGADGGRDIEADSIVADASGHSSVFHWYVECKHYSNAIDWPTLREKLSYAENHAADYLLLVTSSTLSPKCLDEVNRWNGNRKLPAVRHWPGNELPNIVDATPQIGLRYGLLQGTDRLPAAMYGLSWHIAKSCNAAYSSLTFLGTVGDNLELAAALAALMSDRSEILERTGKIGFTSFRQDRDGYDWLKFVGVPPDKCDRAAFRAVCCAIKLALNTPILSIEAAGQNIWQLSSTTTKVTSVADLLREIGYWANFHIEENAQNWRIIIKAGQ
jgi:hypothetical protein